MPPDIHADHDSWRSAMERRIVHIDDSFSKNIAQLTQGQSQLAQSQAATNSTLETVVRTLDQLSNRINQPNPTNWFALISTVISLVVLMGAGVTMKVAPMEATLAAHTAALAANTQVLIDRAKDLGRIETAMETYEKDHDEAMAENKDQWEQISKLREDAAANVAAHTFLKREYQ